MGAAIATAVLVGALIAGDAVKASLLELSMKRLGKTHFALESENHLLRADLGQEISGSMNATLSSILAVQGNLQKGSETRLSQIHVYGIDKSFASFTRKGVFPIGLEKNQVAVSQRVADQLSVELGDLLILSVEKNLVVPVETPVAANDDRISVIPVKVHAVLSDEQLSRFSLRSNQYVPNNLFINRDFLASKIDAPGKANIIIAPSASGLSDHSLQQALTKHARLSDLSLRLREVPELQRVELVSDQVFINRSVPEALEKAGIRGAKILTYFVNEIRIGDYAVPYSFVTGTAPDLDVNLVGREIALNTWTANELRASIGDSVALTYFLQDIDNQLVEHSSAFLLKDILPMQGLAADRLLMPDFPGLGDAESCGEWSPGIPVDLDKIEDRDERYWEAYHGTPKAFISIETAQQLFANKFGAVTALRFPQNNESLENIEERFSRELTPASQGLRFENVLASAISATQGGVDFGQLFIGLSFFIIIAANLLTALLFVFNTEQRRSETKQLLALGFLPGQIRSLRLSEGFIISTIGGILGVGLGIGYAQFIVYGLGSFWRDAVGFSDFKIQLQFWKICLGCLSGIMVSFIAIFLVIRKQLSAKLGAHELPLNTRRQQWARRRKYHLITMVLLLTVTIAIMVKHPADQIYALAKYYTAASLILIIGIHGAVILRRELYFRVAHQHRNLFGLIVRNWSRRGGRNLTAISLLGVGVFTVVSVGLNHHDPTLSSSKLSSGSGGFEFFVETTLPVLSDTGLNLEQGDVVKSNIVVPMRRKTGDDGSCLNLNMVQQPQVLGVNPTLLKHRFSFSKILDNPDDNQGWDLLKQEYKRGIIPAIADMSVIQWGLGLALGDTLHYLDDQGAKLKMVLVAGLANSVFQGNVIISDENFNRYFPFTGGREIFLVDTEIKAESRVALEQSLRQFGPFIQTSDERLVAFGAVENTYLSIFLMLGALGLLIGTAGLGVVLLRNILEDQQELAVLQALGFKSRSLFMVILGEQLVTLLIGLGVGSLAAVVSILPILGKTNPGEITEIIAIIISGMLLNGVFWSVLATRFAFKSDIARTLAGE